MAVAAAVLAVTLFALTVPSSVSAQTPTATATATAAAPKATATTAAPAAGKTGNAGISAVTSTPAVLVLGFVLVAGAVTLASRRATRSR